VNRTPLTSIAPDIFRKRLLAEGYFTIEVTAGTLRAWFKDLTSKLNLRTYGDPVIHATAGQGKEANQGFDAFVPLIDSGIYISVWVNLKFLSTVIYTCADFDEDRAVALVRDFYRMTSLEAAVF
jgi:S-adenosylmethionine decarboxylase